MKSKEYQVIRVANPGDPAVKRPPSGLMPGPNYVGLPGRLAIVQGQVFLVAIVLVAQLWLVTNARSALLTGHVALLGWLALASALSFIVACVVVAPRRRMRESTPKWGMPSQSPSVQERAMLLTGEDTSDEKTFAVSC